MIQVLSILSVLFTFAVMGFAAARNQVHEVADDAGKPPQRAMPKRWTSMLIGLAVVYCFLLLVGLSWAGWFRVA